MREKYIIPTNIGKVRKIKMNKNLQTSTNTWSNLSSLTYSVNNKNTENVRNAVGLVVEFEKSNCNRSNSRSKVIEVNRNLFRDFACYFWVVVKNDSELKVPFH